MVPLKQLMQDYAVKESAQTEAEKDASGYGKMAICGISMVH
jgi:hypothetical protein